MWLGAGTAFALHVIVAVAAGRLISRAPADVVQTGVAVLFGLGDLAVPVGPVRRRGVR